MNDLTQVLRKIEIDDPSAADELLPLVYNALRRLAAQRMSSVIAGHTLNATALVHEVYLRLVHNDQGHRWDSRGHFFAAAAETMRRILIENARRRTSAKRCGERRQLDVYDLDPAGPENEVDLPALDDALTRLAVRHSRTAELVKLRYFTGLTQTEAAHCLAISVATADRDWAYAKAWLHRELSNA